MSLRSDLKQDAFYMCVCLHARTNRSTSIHYLFVLFSSTINFWGTLPKWKSFLYTNNHHPTFCTAHPPHPFAVVEESSLCPPCLDGEDVHGAGAKQGTDGHLLRHILRAVSSVLLLFTFFFVFFFSPPSTCPKLPACFWEVLTLKFWLVFVCMLLLYFSFMFCFTGILPSTKGSLFNPGSSLSLKKYRSFPSN